MVRARQVRAAPAHQEARERPADVHAAPSALRSSSSARRIANDKQLVETLVDSDAWRFNQCRNVFKFLYGRSENQCESKVFDSCVDALVNQKTIQSAVAAVAKDPSFCVK